MGIVFHRQYYMYKQNVPNEFLYQYCEFFCGQPSFYLLSCETQVRAFLYFSIPKISCKVLFLPQYIKIYTELQKEKQTNYGNFIFCLEKFGKEYFKFDNF